MRCDNCRSDGEPAFTLAAYPSEGGTAVHVDFCSIECLQAWTSNDERGIGPWKWGVDEGPRREVRAGPG